MNIDKPIFGIVLLVGWCQVLFNGSVHGQIQGLATMILGMSALIINGSKEK